MKKLFTLSFFLVGFLLLAPSSYASVCTYAGSNPRVTTTELASCGLTGGNGQKCEPYGFFYSGQCTDTSVIQSAANACYTANKSFDGVSGCSSTCLTGYCPSGNSCLADILDNPATPLVNEFDPNGCVAQKREVNCDKTCGNPDPGYLACDTNVGATGCVVSGAGYVCQQDFGSGAGVQAAGSAGSCTAQNMTLASICTGLCSTCAPPYIAGPDSSCVLPLPVAFDSRPAEMIFKVLYGGSWQALTNLITGGGGTPVVLTEFVGLSQLTTTNPTAAVFTDTPSFGNLGGYDLANNFCKNDSVLPGDPHVCSATEIIRTFTTNSSGVIAAAAGQAWIFNGPPGHDATLSNDCKGWKYGQNFEIGYGRFGSVWNFDTDTANIQFCNEALPFACCGS